GLDLSEHAEIGYPEFPQNTLYSSENYSAEKASRQEPRP
ncbi:MAG: Amt family ammonium transporter, partial [Alcanivorax borkumensis]